MLLKLRLIQKQLNIFLQNWEQEKHDQQLQQQQPKLSPNLFWSDCVPECKLLHYR